MPVIKRYANRKLYDPESKRYVTLEDLADFVRRGDEVRVVDHVTGEDLTSVTLMQVIFEEEKKIGGLLPQVLLARMIRAGGSTINNLRGRFASVDPFQLVDEEISRRVQELVEQGRIDEEEGQRLLDLLLRKSTRQGPVTIPVMPEEGPQVESSSDEELADPKEVETLLQQVAVLEQELQKLRGETVDPGL